MYFVCNIVDVAGIEPALPGLGGIQWSCLAVLCHLLTVLPLPVKPFHALMRDTSYGQVVN